MKLNNDFLIDCVQEHLEAAVRYGVTRAWKHSDEKPPSDAQVDTICDSVRTALFEIFSFDPVEEA